MQTLVHHTIPHHHVHNETQGHSKHGHFDHFHAHHNDHSHHHGSHGGHRPSSSHSSHGSHHGSRRPSNSNLVKPNIKPAQANAVAVVPFSISCVHQSLHTLGKHPLTLGFTFLGLNLHDKNLTDAEMHLLTEYGNIMYVDISANSVSDLSVFRNFSCITQFNAW
jgi:hypothetical protein